MRHLRHHHDRFIAASGHGRTWFYESWLSLDDKADRRRWIAYERAASPIWQCMATRVNISLAAEGRSDRIEPLAVGAALAGLIERATQGTGLAGITVPGVHATVDRIVADQVHLTALGAHHISLVTYATMFDRSPVGAWSPGGVDAEAVKSLQTLAWDLVQAERKARRLLTLDECQDKLQSSFIATYWGYTRNTFWRPELGAARSWLRRVRHRLQWHWQLRRGGKDNPFRYDAAADRGY